MKTTRKQAAPSTAPAEVTAPEGQLGADEATKAPGLRRAQAKTAAPPSIQEVTGMCKALRDLAAGAEGLSSAGLDASGIEDAMGCVFEAANRQAQMFLPSVDVWGLQSHGGWDFLALAANGDALAKRPTSRMALDYMSLVPEQGRDSARTLGAHLAAVLAYEALGNTASAAEMDERDRAAGCLPRHRAQANAHLSAAKAAWQALNRDLADAGKDATKGVWARMRKDLPEWLLHHFGEPMEVGFLRAEVTPQGDLRITPLESMRKFKAMAKELLEDKNGNEYGSFDELMQPFMENGYLERVRAEEVGAMTDDTNLFTQVREENDQGDLLGVGVVYHQDDYMIRSALEILLSDGCLVLKGTGAENEAKPKPEWMREPLQEAARAEALARKAEAWR
jgi:hypothetical protein